MTPFSILLKFQLILLSLIFQIESKNLPQAEIPEQDSYTFFFDKFDLLTLNGQTVTSKKSVVKSGRIELFKNTVKINLDGQTNSYQILKSFKNPGGYQLNCNDSDGKRCIVGIISRNGIDYTTLHFIDDGNMTMFEIEKGFTLSINFFN